MKKIILLLPFLLVGCFGKQNLPEIPSPVISGEIQKIPGEKPETKTTEIKKTTSTETVKKEKQITTTKDTPTNPEVEEFNNDIEKMINNITAN